MKFYLSIFAFGLGVFLHSFLNTNLYFSIFLIVLSLVVFVYYYYLIDQKLSVIVSLGIFILFLGVGFLRFDLGGLNNRDVLGGLVGEKVSIIGVVVDEPEVKENSTILVIKNNKDDSKILLTVRQYPRFNYGDELKVIGKLEKPKNFKNKNGREFDYISYLAKDGIQYKIFYPKVELLSVSNGNKIKEKLFLIKNSFLSQIRRVIPDPHVSLLGGLVVGAKESLGKDLQDDFRRTGLIHIVVLSGYNITIVAEFIMRIFSFLPRIFGLSFGALSIVLFAIMTGASATIVRASIMAILVILARLTGRTDDITRSLMLAGCVMVLQNPKILVFDPSFQLSFMATLGLIQLAPRIERYFKFLPTKFQLREAAVATISTQIFVLPLLLYMMGELSLVAVFVNLLVLIFIPITMLLGLLTGVVGMVSLFLSLPFAYLTYFLLAYELKMVEIFSSLPFASINISYFPFWLMIFVYLIYLILFLLNLSSTTSQLRLEKKDSM
jgi:competence protein ComEC